MPNIYIPEELQAKIDHFALTGLVIPVNRSQLFKLLAEALLNNPARIFPDLARKQETIFNGTPKENYETLRSFAPEEQRENA